ncbi:MAG: sugar ABC transporter permease [Fibrobacter sp.]|nr:sugar ABC transporter permease [Fibrobacter sp.]
MAEVKGKKQNLWKKHRMAILFLAPALLALFFLLLVPLLQAIWISLLDLNKSTLDQFLSSPFIGMRNYIEVAFSKSSAVHQGLWDAIRNTVIYTFFVIVGTVVFGLGGALLINRKFKGNALARSLIMLSWVVPSYVVGMWWGFMWQQEEGIINIFLFDIVHLDVWSSWFGVHWEYNQLGELLKPRWLTGENTIWAIIIPSIWRLWPFAMLLFYYALKSIPKEIYEAAEIDGSTKIERFFHITLPLLRPIIALVVLYGVISNVYSFNIITMMFGNGAGLPGRYGDLILPNIFRNVFGVWDFGMGAAMSVLLMGAMAIFSLAWLHKFKEDLSND